MIEPDGRTNDRRGTARKTTERWSYKQRPTQSTIDKKAYGNPLACFILVDQYLIRRPLALLIGTEDVGRRGDTGDQVGTRRTVDTSAPRSKEEAGEGVQFRAVFREWFRDEDVVLC